MVADVVMFNSDEAIFGSQYFSCPVTDESILIIKMLVKEQKLMRFHFFLRTIHIRFASVYDFE